MRHMTVAALNNLAPRTPELKDKLQFPCRMTSLLDMVPVGYDLPCSMRDSLLFCYITQCRSCQVA
jgi:hypothetical protein